MKTELFINNVLIGLNEDVPISFSYSVSDIENPEKRTSSFSKTINIPGSKEINKLFSHFFLVNQANFDPYARASAKVFVDHVLQFSGICQLLAVTTENGFMNYEVVLFGEQKNLFASIGDSELTSLDFSEYDHYYNRDNMIYSWTQDCFLSGSLTAIPCGAGYVYPLIDYTGQGYLTPAAWNYNTFRPALYVKEYIDKIFALHGFTYQSTFFESALFKQLIIPFCGNITESGAPDFDLTDTTIAGEPLIFINSSIPKKIKIKDFLGSIINMFNLQVDVDFYNPSVLIIEPYSTFYTDDIVDWSGKVDESKAFKIAPIDTTIKKYRFTYKVDIDYFNKLYSEKNAGLIYGEGSIESLNEFAKEVKTNTIVFSPTPSVNEPTSDLVFPIFVKSEPTTTPPEIYIYPNIRILYYGGTLSCDPYNIIQDAPPPSSGPTALSCNVYPYAGHLDHPWTPTIDLNFYKPLEVFWGDETNIGLTYDDADNLIEAYHEGPLDEIISPKSRLITYFNRFNVLDINKLSFRKKVFIKGAYFRLKNIHDYTPGSNQSTKVELIKIP